MPELETNKTFSIYNSISISKRQDNSGIAYNDIWMGEILKKLHFLFKLLNMSLLLTKIGKSSNEKQNVAQYKQETGRSVNEPEFFPWMHN